MTEPSHIIVVDEAGGPPLRADTGVPDGYVACAAAIPMSLRDAVTALLPRDGAGMPLKAVSRETTDAVLAAFLESFFALDVAAGLLSVDSTDRANVELLQEAVDFANANRGDRERQFNATMTAYGLLTPKALIAAWSAVCLRQRRPLERFALTLDEANLHKVMRGKLAHAVEASFRDEGVHVDKVRWASEQDEPLLHVPDYIAGVTLRTFTKGDCPASFAQLEQARVNQQLHVLDPVEIHLLPPKKDT